MNYKISKFLVIGLLTFNFDLIKASEINEQDNINNNILNNNINQDKNYSTQINTDKSLTKVEIEEFFNNIKNYPSALNNLKYQLYSIKNKYFETPIFDTIIELLYDYFKEIAKLKNSNLHEFYNKKLSNYKDDKGIQIIILINECLNNPTRQIKNGNFYNIFETNTINDASIIYDNIITKIVRGVNLSEKLIKAKKNIIKDLQNKNTINKNNVITFSNQGKCWFMAYFSFLIAIYDQSDQNEPIRNTNFGRFVTYLHNKQSGFTRKIDIYNKNEDDNKIRRIVVQDNNDYNYLKNGKWENHKFSIGYNESAYESTNVIGERIDLISELLYYWRDDKEPLKNKDEKDIKNLLYQKNIRNKLDNINNISETEKERRNKALELIENLQDLFYGSIHSASSALMIILNIFPELKRFIGNGPVEGFIDGDAMIYCADNTALDNNELKEEHMYSANYNIMNLKDRINKTKKYKNMIENIQRKITNKNSNKYKELQEEKEELENEVNIGKLNIKFYNKQLQQENKKQQNDNKIKTINNTDFSLSNNFVSYWNLGHADVLMEINNGKVFSNKQYLLFEIFRGNTSINDLVNEYRYITHYNNNGKLEAYELISILLSNRGHVVCFAKTGKSDSSWSGIDSSLGYNDDNYTLDDIVYDNNLVDECINGQVLNDKNTYLSKMYHVKNDGKKYIGQTQFYPIAILYKKVSDKEINQTIDKSKKIEKDFLSYFNTSVSYTIMKKEQNKKELIEKFNSEDNDNVLIEFCRKIISDQIGLYDITSQQKENVRELLNNKEYKDEVDDIIHNRIYYIVSKYYEELYNNTKLDDIDFDINDITNIIPEMARKFYNNNSKIWLSVLKDRVKINYIIKNIKNRYRNNYIDQLLIGALQDGMREFMINNYEYRFDYCILSSINEKTGNYFDFRKKYNNEIFSIIKHEFEEMNPSWSMENISRLCNLIKNGYVTNPDIIEYMQENYELELEE